MCEGGSEEKVKRKDDCIHSLGGGKSKEKKSSSEGARTMKFYQKF